jgi:hypothetical protein
VAAKVFRVRCPSEKGFPFLAPVAQIVLPVVQAFYSEISKRLLCYCKLLFGESDSAPVYLLPLNALSEMRYNSRFLSQQGDVESLRSSTLKLSTTKYIWASAAQSLRHSPPRELDALAKCLHLDGNYRSDEDRFRNLIRSPDSRLI